MTVHIGRGLLRLLAALLLILVTLWLAFPLWAAPAARFALANSAAADVDLIALEAARPGLSGLRLDRLVLHHEALHLELAGATLGWRADGQLTQLHVERLALRMTARSGDAGDPAASALPDPTALLRALPVQGLELASVAVEWPSPALRFSGRLEASREQARLAGTVTSPALAHAIAVRGGYDSDGSLRLQVEDDAGITLLDAELALAARAGRIDAEGRIEPRAGLLPALLPEAPTVAGPLSIRTEIGPDSTRLRLLPGTQIVVRGTAPAFTAHLAPEAPWAIAWQDGRLDSDGALEIALAARLPVSETAEPLDVDGRLRIVALAGTAPALDLRGDGDVTIRSGERSAEGLFDVDLQLHSGERLELRSGSGLRAVRFRDPASGLGLEDLALRLSAPAHIDLAALAWETTRVAARAAALQLDAERIDLSALRARAELSGDAEAPQLRVELDGGGLALQARAAVVAGRPVIEVEQADAELGPEALLSSIARHYVPELGLEAGTVELEGLHWPPERATALQARLSALNVRTPEVRLAGLDARLELSFGAETPTLRLADGRLTTLDGGELRAEELTFSAEGRLPDWNRVAAATGILPGALHLETLDLRAVRIAADTRHVDALAVTGTARLDADGPMAALRATAPTLLATVPASDLRCALALTGTALELRDCGLSLLGGQVEVPAATVELDTLSGYLPVALLGLDLGAVLLLMQDEALAGDGVLDGALPLRLAEGVPTVRAGYVGARPPGGRLRYGADAALLERLNQPGLSLAMAALGDFRYRELGARIDYEADGTLGLGVRLAGASPRVENGRAIEFNLNVNQNLPLLLQSLRLSQTIGEAIERRLEERIAPDEAP